MTDIPCIWVSLMLCKTCEKCIYDNETQVKNILVITNNMNMLFHKWMNQSQ